MKYFCSDCENYKAKIQQQAQTIEKLVMALEAITNLEDPGDIDLVSIEASDAFIYAKKAIAEAREK